MSLQSSQSYNQCLPTYDFIIRMEEGHFGSHWIEYKTVTLTCLYDELTKCEGKIRNVTLEDDSCYLSTDWDMLPLQL